MRQGFSLAELGVALAILVVVTAVTLLRVNGLRDWIAVNAAAQEMTTAVAVARHAAVMHGARSRVVIAADSLRIDRWIGGSWEPVARWAGPVAHAVTLEASNPVVQFDAIGLARGVSNTTVVLRRGSHVETITVSRLGRVKRW